MSNAELVDLVKVETLMQDLKYQREKLTSFFLSNMRSRNSGEVYDGFIDCRVDLLNHVKSVVYSEYDLAEYAGLTEESFLYEKFRDYQIETVEQVIFLFDNQ